MDQNRISGALVQTSLWRIRVGDDGEGGLCDQRVQVAAVGKAPLTVAATVGALPPRGSWAAHFTGAIRDIISSGGQPEV